jgi:hypothetical protein
LGSYVVVVVFALVWRANQRAKTMGDDAAAEAEDWALRLAASWRALLRLGLGAAAVLVLDCSAMPPKHGKGALAALCAAVRAADELSLAKVVWVAPRRLIAAAATWRPASYAAEPLQSARVAAVPSEGMRDALRDALREHTNGGAAAAACVVVPPQGAAGGLKTAVGECLTMVAPGGRACLLVSAPGPPGLSKDDSARVIRAVGERQLQLDGCSGGGSGGDDRTPSAVAEARSLWQDTTALAEPPSDAVLSAPGAAAGGADGRLALEGDSTKKRGRPGGAGGDAARAQGAGSKRQKGGGAAGGAGTTSAGAGAAAAAADRRSVKTEGDVAASISYTPIGYMQSCFKERNGTPRQGLLAPHSRATLRIRPDCHPDQSLMGLGDYSHVWLLFDFHANTNARQVRVLYTSCAAENSVYRTWQTGQAAAQALLSQRAICPRPACLAARSHGFSRSFRVVC